MQTITSWIGRHKAWTASSLALVAILAIGGTFGLQTLHHQQTTNTTKKVLGAATAHFSAQQPNFAIVSPKNKPNLAKANGTTSAYDPQRGNYSFQDSLSNYGLIVSEQPVPSKFATATAAVNGIAPTLANSGTSQQAIASSYGLAYVITNPKYNSQTVVAAVKNLIVFIEASHTFSNSDWTTYLDNLQ